MGADLSKRITDITVNETDRALVQMAARVVMALDRGLPRQDAAEVMAKAYRDDIAEAHVGADPDTLDQMTLSFSGALLLEMERVVEDRAANAFAPVTSPLTRPRVIEAIGRYLTMVKPVH